MSRLTTKQRRSRRWRSFETANMYPDGFGVEMHLDAWAVADAGYSTDDARRRGWTPEVNRFAFVRRLA